MLLNLTGIGKVACAAGIAVFLAAAQVPRYIPPDPYTSANTVQIGNLEERVRRIEDMHIEAQLAKITALQEGNHQLLMLVCGAVGMMGVEAFLRIVTSRTRKEDVGEPPARAKSVGTSA